nr:hypothetical protein [Tolivirales sp.]
MEYIGSYRIARETGTPNNTVREAPAVVRPLAAETNNQLIGTLFRFSEDEFQLLKRMGEDLTNFAFAIFVAPCVRCVEDVRHEWYLEGERERRARDIVDGPAMYRDGGRGSFIDNTEEAYSAPEAFLRLAYDVTDVGIPGPIPEEPESTPEPEVTEPQGDGPEDGEPEPEEVTFISSNTSIPHNVELTPPTLTDNYIIKRNKREFYCHTLLCKLKARFGPLDRTNLNAKVIRRNAERETTNHGLRPKDKHFAVEFVVRMYWKASVFDAELDRVSSAYEDVSQSWVKRMFRRFKRAFANPLFGHPIGE